MAIYQFVDAISASPGVLQDLDDQDPLGVLEGVSVSPPQRRVSSFGSSARDGDVTAQDSYTDRRIIIPLEFKRRTTAEEQSETLQQLARLLDRPQWLLWQSEGKTAPVFFRTKYGEIDVADEVLDDKPKRVVTLTITAEPFAFGLPETGSVTITNDPTSGTNKMSYVFPAVKGDVSSPLWLSYMQKVGAHYPVVASMAAPSVSGFPKWVSLTSGTLPSASGGYTPTNVADALFVGGDRRRITTTAGISPAFTAWQDNVTFTPGEYRVFLRAKANASSAWAVSLSWFGAGSALRKNIPASANAAWYDLGVARFPSGFPLASPLYPRPSTPSALVFSVNGVVSSTFDLDGLLFVPVGLDTASDSKLALLETPISGPGATDSARQLQIDGDAGVAFVETQTGDTAVNGVVAAGGFPRVVPGQANLLHYIPNLDTGVATITDTASISWSYFPRYLYDRPAAS